MFTLSVVTFFICVKFMVFTKLLWLYYWVYHYYPIIFTFVIKNKYGNSRIYKLLSNVCSLAPFPSTCSPVDGAIKMYFEQSRIKFDVEKAWFQQWSISEVIYSLVKCGMFRDLHSRFSSSRKKVTNIWYSMIVSFS